jgi:hypothetical protein
MMNNNTNKGTRLDKLTRRYARMADKELVKAWFGRRLLGKEEVDVLRLAMDNRRSRNGGFL